MNKLFSEKERALIHTMKAEEQNASKKLYALFETNYIEAVDGDDRHAFFLVNDWEEIGGLLEFKAYVEANANSLDEDDDEMDWDDPDYEKIDELCEELDVWHGRYTAASRFKGLFVTKEAAEACMERESNHLTEPYITDWFCDEHHELSMLIEIAKKVGSTL